MFDICEFYKCPSFSCESKILFCHGVLALFKEVCSNTNSRFTSQENLSSLNAKLVFTCYKTAIDALEVFTVISHNPTIAANMNISSLNLQGLLSKSMKIFNKIGTNQFITTKQLELQDGIKKQILVLSERILKDGLVKLVDPIALCSGNGSFGYNEKF